MGFEIDTGRYPILLLRLRKPWTLDEWRAGWLELGVEVEAAPGRFGLLGDARAARPPDALERAVVGDFFSRHRDALAERCVGLSVVVSNPLIRAAATAVFWVATPPMPVAFSTSEDRARDLLHESLLDQAGAS